MTARHLVVGPPRHGVVLHAARLAAADPMLQAVTVALPMPASGSAPTGIEDAVPPGSTVFLHVTDRLFGASPEEAARVVTALAARATLGLSLHDVPQGAEGRDWYSRRRATYRDFALAAEVLVVASEFERSLLMACLEPSDDAAAVLDRVTVVPLPVERRPLADFPPGPPSGAEGDGPPEVAVLGYLYPGKGVEDVIDAVADLRPGAGAGPARGPVRVVNHGAAAEGHEDLVQALTARAEAAGVTFRVTGYLDDEALAAAMRSAAVPLAPHRHISASGSVNTWLEAGRRPLLRDGPYARELDARLPGAVLLATSLPAAIGSALEEPSSTWLDDATVLGPTWAEAARAHLLAMDRLS